MKAAFGKFTSILSSYLGDLGYNKLCLAFTLQMQATFRQCCGNHHRFIGDCSFAPSAFQHTSWPFLSQWRTQATQCPGALAHPAILRVNPSCHDASRNCTVHQSRLSEQIKRVLRTVFPHGSMSFNGSQTYQDVSNSTVDKRCLQNKILFFLLLGTSSSYRSSHKELTWASTACLQVT